MIAQPDPRTSRIGGRVRSLRMPGSPGPTRSTGESLRPQDAALFYAESPGTQLQIGALCWFEAGPLRDGRGRLRIADLRDHVARRLATVPRFRQRVATVAWDLAAPRWVDDEDIDLAHHVRVARLESPGGSEQLRRMIGDALMRPFDTAHPLWDLTVIDADLDFPDERVPAIPVLLRAHHAMADGLALHAAATLLLDPAPTRLGGPAPTWDPAVARGSAALAAAAVVDRNVRRIRAGADLAGDLLTLRTWWSAAIGIGGLVRAVPDIVGAGRRVDGPALRGAVGAQRAFAWTTLPMADVVDAKRHCAATVNDVVLAVVTGALRRADDSFSDSDGHPSTRRPRALIPVGDPGSEASLGNRFSVSRVELPVHEADPVERVRALHRRTHPPDGTSPTTLPQHVFALVDLLPPPLLRAVVPAVLDRQPLVDLAVSDIPGSRVPLHLGGSRLLGLHPFIDVVGNLALMVCALSYVDHLGIGVTVDPEVVGDPRSFAGHLEAAARELTAAVGGST